VSQHLKLLKDAGLVAEQSEGRRRIYRLNEAGLLALRDQLDAFWRNTLEGFGRVLEDRDDEESP
jgi:DNA-binding transcriptional ArsR family regulator